VVEPRVTASDQPKWIVVVPTAPGLISTGVQVKSGTARPAVVRTHVPDSGTTVVELINQTLAAAAACWPAVLPRRGQANTTGW
jgi:hypothetical protein